jgi:hypothetical protein
VDEACTVTWCGESSVLVHDIDCPGFTSTFSGPNRKSAMLTMPDLTSSPPAVGEAAVEAASEIT